jgi:hypothetical protein
MLWKGEFLPLLPLSMDAAAANLHQEWDKQDKVIALIITVRLYFWQTLPVSFCWFIGQLTTVGNLLLAITTIDRTLWFQYSPTKEEVYHEILLSFRSSPARGACHIITIALYSSSDVHCTIVFNY